MTTIREQRESLGLSRKELADEAGVTVGALASVESGRGSRDKDAEAKILQAITARITPQTKTEGEKATPRAFREGPVEWARKVHPTWEYLTEWNGLTPEARFTVRNVEGVFAFLYFVRTDKGAEWVNGIGGERGYPAATHSFIPEDIVPFV